MYDKALTIEENLRLLAEAPGRIGEMTEGLTAEQLVKPPQEGEWSVGRMRCGWRTMSRGICGRSAGLLIG